MINLNSLKPYILLPSLPQFPSVPIPISISVVSEHVFLYQHIAKDKESSRNYKISRSWLLRCEASLFSTASLAPSNFLYLIQKKEVELDPKSLVYVKRHKNRYDTYDE